MRRMGKIFLLFFEKLPDHEAKQGKSAITLFKDDLRLDPKIKLVNELVKTIGYFERLLSPE